MLTLRRDPEGKPCFSPDFRGVAVEDGDGLATLVDVTALPEALSPAERHEVAQALYQSQAPALEVPATTSGRDVSGPGAGIGVDPHHEEERPSQAATVAPSVAGPDLARELAQELAGSRRGGNGGGRPLSPEEQAANVRRANALADKAEAEASLARVKARQAEAAAEARPPQVPATIIPDDIAQAQIRAQRMALSRRITEDTVAQTEATEDMVALARRRIADYHHLQAQKAQINEEKRRRALGTSNSQLFWRGLLGFLGGGILAGLVANALGCDPGHCSAIATGGQLAGAWWAVASRVAKGRREERKEAYLEEREAAPQPQAGTWAAGAAAMAASTLDANTGRR